MSEVPGSGSGWSWARGARRYLVVVVGVLVLLGFGVLGSPGPAQAAGRASVSVGSAPKVPAGAIRTGALAGATVLHAEVILAQRDPAGLEQLATAVSTPTSPRYRQYLTAGQVGAMFGPTPATIQAVRTALEAAGLTTG
ncbi:protease pro-enzyme activation domain-containing protein, partial [Leekyejoonella antrihumi]